MCVKAYLAGLETLMPNEKRGVFTAIEAFIDMILNLISILMGYLLVMMIHWGEERIINIIHPVAIVIIFCNMLVASFIYHVMNLYKHMRYLRPFRSFPAVFRANFVYFGIMTIITTFVARPGYRQIVLFWILFSAIISTSFLTFKRHLIKVVLQLLRKKQYHLRKVIIIGDNTATAVDYIKEIASNSQYGMTVIGYVGDKIDGDALGVDKLGSFRDLERIIEKHRPTDAVFAIDAYDKRHLIRLVNLCDDKCIKVYFLPVIYGFFKNSRQIEQVGSVPLINIHSTPLDNLANAALKRAFDIIGASLLILLVWPIMIFAMIGVKISSPGPIFFKQKRVGMLGKKFTMLKFRSMRVNKDSDKAWSTGTDPRKTKFGTFLRRTAIDELPQLFNVLAGSMSLVGPRPEIPVFVDHFRQIVPLYMIKHYVKPGITGLAQIKGFRGDTSIEARIHEDIEYIENWSFWLDIAILLKTPLKAFNKNEKYVNSKGEEGVVEEPELPTPIPEEPFFTKDEPKEEEPQSVSAPESSTSQQEAPKEENTEITEAPQSPEKNEDGENHE